MKNLFIILMAFTALSCSTEDNEPLSECTGNSAQINAQFDTQIQWVRDHTSPDDEVQIGLINEERAAALVNACE